MKKEINIMELGGFLSSEEILWNMQDAGNLFTGNTTLGVVLTNAGLDKTSLNKVASMAHNGYARAIRPVHTMADGDSIYAASVGRVASDVNIVGSLSAYVMGKAINRAVLAAKGLGGVPAAGEYARAVRD